MGVTSVNLARISFNYQAQNLYEAMRQNQLGLNRVQNQLATGLRYQLPSDEPIAASRAMKLDARLDQLRLVKNNVAEVNSVLTEVESSLQDAIDLFRDTKAIALQGVDDGISSEERKALATVVDSLIDQMVAVGNRQYLNTWLYAGHQDQAPFELSNGGVIYRGDGNRRETILDTDLSTDYFTIPGTEFFGAVSTEVRGFVDLDPALTTDTRVSDLNGTTGDGVRLGSINVTAGVSEVQVDLSSADTMGDVIDLLNAQLPAGLVASLDTNGITFAQFGTPVSVSITEIGDGTTARDLGIDGTFSAPLRAGTDLDPRLTKTTSVTSLLADTGLNVNDTLVVRNGGNSATINMTGAETVEDILNRLNRPELGVWARISEDGSRIELVNRISGTQLTVEEDGGNLATALGIRSLYSGTPLAELNDGLGVETVDGDDIRITTRSGATIDLDLDGLYSIQDVVDLINTNTGGAVTAALVASGNGIQIQDNTAGTGTFGVSALNASPALGDLGLDVTTSGGTLTGRNVNPLIVDSPFTALLELREGLLRDDRQTINTAAARIDRVMIEMQRAQGEVASQARTMADRTDRVEREVAGAEILLSDARDVDFADAVVRFQQLQTALEANLSTASRVLNLSLLDYLR